MSKDLIIALDQGTTSSRVLVFNRAGEEVCKFQQEFTQFYPNNGWVEHDPLEILSSQMKVLHQATEKIDVEEVAAIGITNQRETTVVWNKNTGKPVYNAIVWQDRRTAEFCQSLNKEGKGPIVKEKTGLVLDAYFSGSKIRWILDNVEGASGLANSGELLFGTIDTWLIWNLTKGKVHATDVTNASRTMLFNIKTMAWDEELLNILGVPKSMLPTVLPCTGDYGHTEINDSLIPITGVAGDQQAALFGQLCLEKGSCKNTYGTGCFMVMNTGNEIVVSNHNLLSTVGYQLKGQKPVYALEGSVFVGGAVVQWLRDGLKIISNAKDTESIAESVADSGGVFFVPALTGLGAPHWDQFARGAILGLTRSTSEAHIVRAALESIAYQVNDLMEAMAKDLGAPVSSLKVDGGATANNLLMQLQSNISNTIVIRPANLETTAIGAAFFAGLQVGIWSDVDELKSAWQLNKSFEPQDSKSWHENKKTWSRAVERAKNWIV
jgi:glycerol kinase